MISGNPTDVAIHITNPVVKEYITVSGLQECSTIGMQTSMAADPGTAVDSIYPNFFAKIGMNMIPDTSRITLCINDTALAIAYWGPAPAITIGA